MEDWFAHLRRLTGVFEETVRTASLAERVPACPGWSVYDLVCHLGQTHTWAGDILTTGHEAAETDEVPASVTAEAAAEWYAGTARRLLHAVQQGDPSDACWNFAGVRQTRGFWSRRQVHETQMHVVDLGQAAGVEPDLDPELSADGVAEVFEVFAHRMVAKGVVSALAAPTSLVATDVGRVWHLTPDPAGGAPRLRASSGALADDQARGTAAELLTVMWKRRRPELLDVVGDRERVLRFLGSALTP